MYHQLIAAVFTCTGFWTLVNNIYQSRKKKLSAEQELLRGLAHDRLLQEEKRILKQGFANPDELVNINSMYIPYRKLCGNGKIKTLYEEVQKLEIRYD